MTFDPWRRPEALDHTELARLLPAPGDPVLPPDRQHRLEDMLMRAIEQDRTAATPSPRPRARRRLIALPLAAAALAAAIVGGVTVTHQGTTARHGTVQAAPGTSGSSTTHTVSTAAVLLDRIATVAASQPAPVVRNDQFTYVESAVSVLQTSTDAQGHVHHWLDKPVTGRVWTSVDGSRPVPVQAPGGLGRPGKVSMVRIEPSLNTPTYRLLETLPIDPDALLQKIYTTEKGHGPGPDQEAFTTIGDLLGGSIAPPKISAALYRAAAKIPGVTVVADAVDAAGRHGIAVARTDQGERTEWIFDKATLQFLGERSVMTQDEAWAKAGQVTGVSAVLERAVVDEAGQIPHSAA